MATCGAIGPASPKSGFLTSLIFRVFQRYRRRTYVPARLASGSYPSQSGKLMLVTSFSLADPIRKSNLGDKDPDGRKLARSYPLATPAPIRLFLDAFLAGEIRNRSPEAARIHHSLVRRDKSNAVLLMRRWFLSYHSPDRALAERLKAALNIEAASVGGLIFSRKRSQD